MRDAPFDVPAAYGGFDRGNPPDIGAANTIYQHSNLDVLGYYLAHNPEGLLQKNKRSQKWVDWKPSFPQFLQQGWGTFFLFNSDNRAPGKGNFFTDADARDPVGLGIQHGRTAKRFAAALGHEAQGAVVFIDNEDDFNNLDDIPAFKDYIITLMDELGKAGSALDDPPPVRPGFYVRQGPARVFLPHRPNMMLWFTDNNVVPKEGLPYSYSQGSLIMPIGQWPISAIPYGKDGNETRRALSLGRQWMFYDEGDQNIHVGGAKIVHLDFSTSMVRDPRYPVAQPRIAVWENIMLRTFFSKTDLSMHVERVWGGKRWPTLIQPKPVKDDLLEPEAPVVLVVETYIDQGPDAAPPNPELFTLSKAGLPVSFKATPVQNLDGWAWSNPVRIVAGSEKLVLRRNRAMSAVKRSRTDTQLFFVSDAHVLVGVRRLADDAWSAPMPLAGSEPLHWFSNLIAIARDDVTVDIFYVDRQDRLHTAWWPSTSTTQASQEQFPTPWPGSRHQPLPLPSTGDTSASPILQSTALAAVSPSRDTILVFAVGKDHGLYMASFHTNSGWAPLSVVRSSNTPDEPVLFPHTQLSALTLNDTTVYVAAYLEINVPCIYHLTRSEDGTTWKLDKRIQCPNPPPTVAPAGKSRLPDGGVMSEGSAAGYTFNPFGDVVLAMQGVVPVLFVAGVTGDRNIVGPSGEKPSIRLVGNTLTPLKGWTGGNRGLLFAKVNEAMVWMLMK